MIDYNQHNNMNTIGAGSVSNQQMMQGNAYSSHTSNNRHKQHNNNHQHQNNLNSSRRDRSNSHTPSSSYDRKNQPQSQQMQMQTTQEATSNVGNRRSNTNAIYKRLGSTPHGHGPATRQRSQSLSASVERGISGTNTTVTTKKAKTATEAVEGTTRRLNKAKSLTNMQVAMKSRKSKTLNDLKSQIQVLMNEITRIENRKKKIVTSSIPLSIIEADIDVRISKDRLGKRTPK